MEKLRHYVPGTDPWKFGLTSNVVRCIHMKIGTETTKDLRECFGLIVEGRFFHHGGWIRVPASSVCSWKGTKVEV